LHIINTAMTGTNDTIIIVFQPSVERVFRLMTSFSDV